MRIDVTQAIKDFKNEPVLNENKEPVTFRDIASVAINTEDNEHRMTAEKKNQAFQIGIKLWSDKEVDLTVDQAALIKERVGLFYSPAVYGRVCEMLEGEKNTQLSS